MREGVPPYINRLAFSCIILVKPLKIADIMGKILKAKKQNKKKKLLVVFVYYAISTYSLDTQ